MSALEVTCSFVRGSGVARAFPGGRVAHPESQNEEENEKHLRKSKKNCSKFEEKVRKVELLPTRDCEACKGPGSGGGGGKARFNVATPTYATVTCTAYVLLYNLQTKSI